MGRNNDDRNLANKQATKKHSINLKMGLKVPLSLFWKTII